MEQQDNNEEEGNEKKKKGKTASQKARKKATRLKNKTKKKKKEQNNLAAVDAPNELTEEVKDAVLTAEYYTEFTRKVQEYKDGGDKSNTASRQAFKDMSDKYATEENGLEEFQRRNRALNAAQLQHTMDTSKSSNSSRAALQNEAGHQSRRTQTQQSLRQKLEQRRMAKAKAKEEKDGDNDNEKKKKRDNNNNNNKQKKDGRTGR